LYGNDAADIGATAVLGNGQLLIGDGSGVPTLATLTQASANRVVITNAAGSITLSLPQDIHTAAVPQFGGVTAAYIRPAANGVATLQIRRADGTTNILNVDSTNNRIGINTTTPDTDLHVNGNIKTVNFQMTSGAALNYVLTSNALGNASWVDPSAGGLGDGWVGNEVTDTANTTLTRSGNGLSLVTAYKLALNLGNANTWTGVQTFSNGLAGALTGNADTVTNGIYTTTNLVGDVTGTPGATVVGADSHAHTGTSISALNAGDITTGTLPVGRGGTGNTSGNAATVTDGVYITGAQTIGGVKTFSSTIAGSINGNAATATKPSVGGTTSRVVCWKADGTLSYCTGIIVADGSCPCN
ncbi:MAG: hypothetical protein Q7R35_05305, partial [Elusimicrobiota bacterium]|nr:hypothetical protein [Elusimicrobiota bacterium]